MALRTAAARTIIFGDPVLGARLSVPAYRHTQVGYLTLVTGAVGALLALALVTVSGQGAFLVLIAAVLVILCLFASLTIEVADGELRHHFTFGFWGKRVPLADIVSAEAARSHWWEGWGIRVTFGGMLYNVSGTRVVEVHVRNGRTFRLGTDEPEALAAAIRAGISNSGA